jgi:Transposase DDE domain group 1
MEVTQKVNATHGRKGPGRIEIRADEEGLTPHAGLAIIGELARRTGLVGMLDGEIAANRRAAPIKQRRRGVTPGELLSCLAEAQLAGAENFADLENMRADESGAPLRTVADVPSSSSALQLAKRFRRSHLQRAERAMARAAAKLDEALGRDPSEDVTIDLDATDVEVFGVRKQGAARNRTGQLAYCPYAAFWAQRGRCLTSELHPGNMQRLAARDSATIAKRAVALLPAEHGNVSFRVDSAFFSAELLEGMRAMGATFTVSVPRHGSMWSALERIPDQDWRPATEMHGAEVAETTYSPKEWKGEPLRLAVRRVALRAADLSSSAKARRRRTIHPDQLALLEAGEAPERLYAYSFILTDRDEDAAWVEHHHRHRAQIEERIREAKLGVALRRMPSGDLNANRAWMFSSLLAVNLAAMVCDVSPLAGASGKAPAGAPLRRAARTLRRLLFAVPARVIRTGRRTILRLPAGFRYAEAFAATYRAAWALPPP